MKKNVMRLLPLVLILSILVCLTACVKEPTPFTVTSREVPELDVPEFDIPILNTPDIPDTGDGSLHSKLFKRVTDSGTTKYTVVYCEGTYNGAPDDTVLALGLETEFDRSYDVDSYVSYLYQGIYAVQGLNNPHFAWRENNSEYYYNIDLDFDHLDSSDSAELVPNVAALVGLGANYTGSTLKMSDVEDSLLSNGYTITYAD